MLNRTPSPEAKPTFQVRRMKPSDVPQILQIERLSFPSPWSATSFLLCIRAGHVCRVLQRDNRIVGYGLISVDRDTAHLLNLCIRPDFHGRGWGRRLLVHLLDQASSQGANTVYLEVRPTNQVALHLYYSLGFREIGLRKNYYAGPPQAEDALVLLANLNENAPQS